MTKLSDAFRNFANAPKKVNYYTDLKRAYMAHLHSNATEQVGSSWDCASQLHLTGQKSPIRPGHSPTW